MSLSCQNDDDATFMSNEIKPKSIEEAPVYVITETGSGTTIINQNYPGEDKRIDCSWALSGRVGWALITNPSGRRWMMRWNDYGDTQNCFQGGVVYQSTYKGLTRTYCLVEVTGRDDIDCAWLMSR